MPTISTDLPNPLNPNATLPAIQITLNDHVTIFAQRSTTGSSTISSSTQIEDMFSTANSLSSGYATHVIEGTIPANGTAFGLANTPTTLNDTITPTSLRYLRLYNPTENLAIIFTTSINGFPTGTILPGGHIKWFANASTGLAIPANGTITATGANTTQTLRITMLVN